MGWIKAMLPEPDDQEYQQMMERAWEDAHFDWWHEQDKELVKKENDNAK